MMKEHKEPKAPDPETTGESMPEVPVNILGEKFSVADKYVGGMTINADEAAALNQTRRENIRNNAAKFIRQMRDGELTEETCRDEVLRVIRTYQFGGAHLRREKLSAVEREARDIATRSVRAQLREQPHLLAGLDKDTRQAKIKGWIAAHTTNPEVVALAEREVARKATTLPKPTLSID